MGKADYHPVMAFVRLIFVCSEKVVPPRKIEAVIAVRFADDHGMMHPVHVGGHDKAPKDSVNRYGNMDVAVVEHGCGIEDHFENEYRQDWGA